MAAAVGPRGKRVQTPQQTRSPPAPLPVALPEVPREQTAALAHAAKGVEALGVLVQYLVFRVSSLLIFYIVRSKRKVDTDHSAQSTMFSNDSKFFTKSMT